MEDKTYIPGIYNYCDHWCEKCTFTANCFLFASESKIAAHEILNNGEMPDFKDIYKNELSQDEEDGDFFGDDDPEIIEEEQYQDEEEVNDFKADSEIEETYLEELSYEYLMSVHSFLDKLYKNYPFLSSRSVESIQAEHKSLYNCTEILSWYHTFQYPKFKRAVDGKNELNGDEDIYMKEFAMNDMNGSAKIAIIAINKSIAALNHLFTSLPEFNCDIAGLLVISGKLLNEAEKEFPDYKSFQRPGFDD